MGFHFHLIASAASGGTPLVRIRDVLRGRTDTRYDGKYDPNYLVNHGDLLVGMDGHFNCAPWGGEPALLNQRVCKVVADERYYSGRFLKYVLQDSAITALERVQRNLKRYRAAVLQAAVEGRLVPTEAELARAEGRTYEPASELLRRILAERRRLWEDAELARLTTAGKAAKNDETKEACDEPPQADARTFPTLPEGWRWASIDQLGEVSGGLTKNARRHALGQHLPYLRVANVMPMSSAWTMYRPSVWPTRRSSALSSIAAIFSLSRATDLLTRSVELPSGTEAFIRASIRTTSSRCGSHLQRCRRGR
jgi:type I restriction enzyme S subunit